jgi:hypothetical protein
MTRATITNRAKIAVLLMIAIAVSLLIGLTCKAAESPQAHLTIQLSSSSIWIRIGPLPKRYDSGIFKKSLVGPIFQYIDDPLDDKADTHDPYPEETAVIQ